MAARTGNLYLDELNDAIKRLTSDNVAIMAVPGVIRNNGKNVDAVQVTIGYNPTKKLYTYVYRGLSTNFRAWLKARIDKIENQ